MDKITKTIKIEVITGSDNTYDEKFGEGVYWDGEFIYVKARDGTVETWGMGDKFKSLLNGQLPDGIYKSDKQREQEAEDLKDLEKSQQSTLSFEEVLKLLAVTKDPLLISQVL